MWWVMVLSVLSVAVGMVSAWRGLQVDRSRARVAHRRAVAAVDAQADVTDQLLAALDQRYTPTPAGCRGSVPCDCPAHRPVGPDTRLRVRPDGPWVPGGVPDRETADMVALLRRTRAEIRRTGARPGSALHQVLDLCLTWLQRHAPDWTETETHRGSYLLTPTVDQRSGRQAWSMSERPPLRAMALGDDVEAVHAGEYADPVAVYATITGKLVWTNPATQPDPPQLDTVQQISDRYRQAAQDRLADHLAAGRLDVHEYADRVGVVWAAQVQADLAPSFADLPGGLPGDPDGPPADFDG